jgi:hypothetical protein
MHPIFEEKIRDNNQRLDAEEAVGVGSSVSDGAWLNFTA